MRRDGRFPEFRSMDERCNACEVFGGDQGACVQQAILDEIFETHGRPCPRVVLDDDNVEAWELLPHALGDSSGLAVPAFLPIICRNLDPDEQHEVLTRVMAVATDPQVRRAQRALAAARAEADRRERAARAESDRRARAARTAGTRR